MSYIVLARRWRPQKFDDVIGQEHITQTLKNSILSGKLAHAYLFVGPRGVGKTSCARILAKSLNCKDAPTVTPCGECSACREISEGRSLDVIEIDGASNRGIDEIRTLRENVKFSPVSGKYKIYIIDEVHMLTQEAFNALLKTLEEPPEHVKFIFATTQPAKILPTILSRCQRFEFNRIPILKIIAKLDEISKSEGISINKDVFFDIANISDGSMRDAESVLDQLVSFSKNEIKPGDVIAVMGLIEQDAFFEFVDALKNKDTQFCIDFIAKLFTRGKNISKFLTGLMWHLRNIMVSKIMKADNLEELLDLPQNITEKVIEQAKKLSLQEVINMFTAVVNTQEMAKKINSFRIPLEVMVIKLTCKESEEKPVARESIVSSGAKIVASKIKLNNVGSLFSGATKQELTKPVANPKTDNAKEPDKEPLTDKNKDNSTVSTKEEDKAADKPAPHIDFDKMINVWPQVIDAVSEKKMSVATYLKDSRPLRLENGVLTIGFAKRAVFYKEAVEQRHNQKIIVDRINDLFNTMLSLKFELFEDIDNLGKQDIKDAQNNQDSEFVKSVLNTFNGRLFRKD
ncbi:MAG: DNA polymerase III subunit gamma/tau [Candidatus Omnitrophica bacterium]|nr:DNA polymerase III subunit gamma/tau [Candidatus Omnitrophota bacterium]MDD5352844.1 DNA polymerase III subunit gamma/tau [Candidatus Omnitrophota bacterium]MDD5550443.1 DNA polymerase III subunit gamma/tau [Candidatus Omnitrophota bacterium]